MNVINSIINGTEKVLNKLNKPRPQTPGCALKAIEASQKQAEFALSSNNPIKTAQLLSAEEVTAAKKAVILINFFKALPDSQWMGPKPTLTGSLIEQADLIRAWIQQPGVKEYTYLDLSGKSLRALPPEIGEFTGLLVLKLSDNKLTELPSEIGLLTKLIGLSVAHNKLTTLPEEITNLVELLDLILSHNEFSGTVPDVITDFPNLDILNIDYNNFHSFPTGMGRLKSLTTINCEGNAPSLQLSPVVFAQYAEQAKAHSQQETIELNKRAELIEAAHQAAESSRVEPENNEESKVHSLYDGDVALSEPEESPRVELEVEQENSTAAPKARSFYDNYG